MGFFSWQCKGCDQSVKAPYHQELSKLAWQSDAVCLKSDGDVYSGEYDGYGSIDDPALEPGENIWEDSEPELWHKRCWENAGKPSFTGASEAAEDQGYFFDPDEELEGAKNE